MSHAKTVDNNPGFAKVTLIYTILY